jgi:hypothetical protein
LENLGRVNYIELSGIENLTDFAIFKLANKLKNNPNITETKLNDTKYNSCQYITIWSLSYMSKIIKRSLFDFHNLERNNFEVK